MNYAIHLLTDKGSGEVLHCDDFVPTSSGNVPVIEVLKEKHPLAQLISTDSVISSDNPPTIHPIIFDALDA